MVDDEQPTSLTRAERRRRSEASILRAARELLAERGFERTTIRGVAERAGVDPALVMQHFGTKDGLFAAAATWSVPIHGLLAAGREDLPRAAIEHVLDAFDDPGLRGTAEAVLRSCLTHPAAGAIVREQVLGSAQTAVATTIGGPDAELRAALLNACTLGLSIARYLLAVPALADVGRADLDRVLGPALQALVDPT